MHDAVTRHEGFYNGAAANESSVIVNVHFKPTHVSESRPGPCISTLFTCSLLHNSVLFMGFKGGALIHPVAKPASVAEVGSSDIISTVHSIPPVQLYTVSLQINSPLSLIKTFYLRVELKQGK